MLFGMVVQGFYYHAFDDHGTLVPKLHPDYLVYAPYRKDFQRSRYFMRKAMCDNVDLRL